MKFKILLIVTPLLSLSVAALANPLVDSVGVENQNGKKVILHKLDPKDNYYSIGRRYNISPKAIMQFNNNAPLKIGGVVKVPTEQSFVLTATPSAPVQAPVQQQSKPAAQTQVAVQQPKPQIQPSVAQPQQTQPAPQQQASTPPPAPVNTQPASTSQQNIQQYKVSVGETLFSIAKRFGTSVEDITALNKLTSTALAPGQILLVRTGMPPADDRPVMPKDSVTVAAQDSISDHSRANRFGLFEKNEKGVATWIEDTSLDPKKELVLHRTAPIGTVVKITNPMNNHTTFAKVVGRFTDNEATKDVIIVMTKNTADALGALDKRFHVNISYGTPNE